MQPEYIQPTDLLTRKTATGYGSPVGIAFNQKICFQAVLEGTSGAVSATVKLYGTMDETVTTAPSSAALIELATFTLSGTGAGLGTSAASDVWGVEMPYRWFIANVTAISGTGAAISIKAGV